MSNTIALAARLFWSDLIRQFELTQEEGLDLLLDLCFTPSFFRVVSEGIFEVHVRFTFFPADYPFKKGWDVRVTWYNKGNFSAVEAELFSVVLQRAIKISQIELGKEYAGFSVPDILEWMKKFSSKFNTRESLLEAFMAEK